MKPWAMAMIGAAAGVLALPAAAEMESCWVRKYTPDHLAKQPEQVVAAMWLSFHRQPETGDLFASLAIVASESGHVARAGQAGRYFDQGLICFDGPPLTCAVECDGGSFQVKRQTGDVLDISTSYLMVGDTEGCGGAVDLAERPGEAVTYRLYRADSSLCETN